MTDVVPTETVPFMSQLLRKSGFSRDQTVPLTAAAAAKAALTKNRTTSNQIPFPRTPKHLLCTKDNLGASASRTVRTKDQITLSYIALFSPQQ